MSLVMGLLLCMRCSISTRAWRPTGLDRRFWHGLHWQLNPNLGRWDGRTQSIELVATKLALQLRNTRGWGLRGVCGGGLAHVGWTVMVGREVGAWGRGQGVYECELGCLCVLAVTHTPARARTHSCNRSLNSDPYAHPTSKHVCSYTPAPVCADALALTSLPK